MAKNNYKYEKRQKDIAKKKKQEKKRLKKLNKNSHDDDGNDTTESVAKDAEVDGVMEK